MGSKPLTHLSLFTGIGGLDLAAEWAGFQTVGQCEWADYPTKVLEMHWPAVPRWRDIRTLTGEDFYARTGLRTVDVISGGFPCQPFSTAGVRRGKSDDRYLWPEMLRVIQDLRPTWVIGENVVGIIDMALDTVLSDLETIDYTVQAFIIPACSVDAPHRRYRVFIVAHSNGDGREGPRQTPKEGYDIDQERPIVAEGGPIPNADKIRCDVWGSKRQGIYRGEPSCHETDPSGQDAAYPKGSKCKGERANARRGRSKPGRVGWWPPEPNAGRVAYGVPSGVDRLGCLGNAVVPQQAYPIFKAIYDLEEALSCGA